MADISPTRLDLAKKTLQKLYARTGGMPSVLAFAKAMGYSSTASAYEVTEALVAEGFLSKGPTGRLLPGSGFDPLTIQVPAEMLAILSAGVDTRTLRVQDDSMSDDGILWGDYLVVIPADRAEKGAYVLSKGSSLAIADEAHANRPGWNIEGRLVAQFRSYR